MLENETVDAPQADTRKDVLAQQFAQVETEAAANPAPVISAPKVEAAPTGERLRAPDGKFIPKEAAAAPIAPVVDPTAPPAEPPIWERPPQSWKKDFHEPWKTIDPKSREYIWQREEQMRAGIEPLIPKAKFADEVQKVLEPYMGTLRGLGVSPPQAIEALIRTDHTLRNSPPDQRRQIFMQLASQYGVSLNPVEGEQPQQGQMPPEVFNLKNELTNLRGEVLSWKEQQERAANEQLQLEINKFSAKHEFFEDVRPTMAKLLQSGMAETMDDAYEQAIRLNPELFDTIQSRKQAEEAAKNSAALNDAAKRARAAAVSVKSSTPGAPPTTKAQDRRSKLAEQFDGLSERL